MDLVQAACEKIQFVWNANVPTSTPSLSTLTLPPVSLEDCTAKTTTSASQLLLMFMRTAAETNGTWKCFLETDHILLTLNLHNLGTQSQNCLLAYSRERINLLQPTLYMGWSTKGLKLGLLPPLLLFKAQISNFISKVKFIKQLIV